MDLRDHALAYAARGWPVFPLHTPENGGCSCGPDCKAKNRGKHPRTPTGLKEATTNVNVIERWWDRWPDANLGVTTGAAMKAWVLDVDGEIGSASLTALEEKLGPLPDTLEVRTGSGGRHLFFAWPEGRQIGNRGALGRDLLGKGPKDPTGLDVRGEGGYVVAPPSLHYSGGTYSWLTKATDPIAAAPKAWLDFVCPLPKAVPPWERVDPVAPPAPKPRRASTLGRTPVLERARLYLAEVDPAVQGSGGHNALLWAARALVVGFELDDATATELLWSDFNPRCQPPWDEGNEKDRRDFERKVAEARKTPGTKAIGWLLDEYGLRTGAEAMAQIARGAESAALLLASAAKRPAAPAPVAPDAPEPPAPSDTYRDFPTGLFPERIRDFCAMVSEAHNVYLSFVALPVLVVAGTAMGNAWRLALKRQEGWVVPPTLWGGLVGLSGANKTGPLAEIVEPLNEVIRPESIPDPMLNPQGRVVVQDTTVEALVALMQSSGRRGLLCFNDELVAWAKNFDRGKKDQRGGGGGEQAWLQFWNARRYMVDRKTNNEHINVPAAACSVLGGIQPSLLASCFDPSKFASGLVARLLIVCPPRKVPRWTDEDVTDEARSGWADVVSWLRCTPFKGLDANAGQFKPRVVRFDPHAKVLFEEFWTSSKAEMLGEQNEHALTLHAKSDTHAARLALVHHGLRIACGERDLDAPVTRESARAGIEWARWFLAEQLRAYGYTATVAREEGAAELAELIRQKLPTRSATPRQVMRLNSARWKTAEIARASLAHVVEFGHGRWADKDRDKVILNEVTT